MTQPAGPPRLIEELDWVPVAELRTYHRNPRRGSVPAIRQSLQVNGQYKALVANRGSHTGRPGEVLAGNHTLLAARDLGWSGVYVAWVDVDDDQAARIVAVDNRSADLAEGYDDRLLLELLAGLPDLDGTGYDPGDLDDLVAALEEADTAAGAGVADAADGATDAPPSIFDLGDAYADRATRQVVLTYPIDTFEWMIGQLADLADQYGVESNSDVVAALVVRATGATPPVRDPNAAGPEHGAWAAAPVSESNGQTDSAQDTEQETV